VGDTYSQDILGACQLGFKTIWLNVRKENLEEEQKKYQTSVVPDVIIESIHEIDCAISQI